MVVPAGRRFEPEGKAGLAKMTASMMAEASQKSTVEELSSRLGSLGQYGQFLGWQVWHGGLCDVVDQVPARDAGYYAGAFVPASV